MFFSSLKAGIKILNVLLTVVLILLWEEGISQMALNILTKKIRCFKCHGKVTLTNDFYLCKKCKFKVYLPSSNKLLYSHNSLGERIFDVPFLYNLKIKILNKLNLLNIPINPSAKALQKADHLYPNSYHLISSADKLPFADKTFDVTLFLFALHHLTKKQWNCAINEAVRVTRQKIIIYDHVRNENPILYTIQKIYWKMFDGGEVYPSEENWSQELGKFKIVKYQRVGSLFRHIVFYDLDL